MRISFLVVNYLSADFTVKLCESIGSNLVNVEYEILVFNNSPTDAEISSLDKIRGSRIQVFSSGENIGFVKGNNYLFRHTTGEIVVLINPDVLLIDKSINQIIEKMERDQTIGIAGPKLLNEDRSYQVSFVRFPSLSALIKEHIFLSRKNPYAQGLNDEVEQACDVIKGACLFIRRDIVIGDKLFDEDFVMYSEEVDLCHRVKQAGYEIKYIPSCTVIHYGERSSSPKKAREYSTYHYFKSKLIFARKQQSIWDYLITRLILSVSLTEKIIMLFLIGHFYNSAVHLKVFIRLVFAHIHISSANVQIKRCE